MKIAIVGAGRVGSTLGTRWSATGHDVVYGVRDPSEPRHAELGSTATPADAVRGAGVGSSWPYPGTPSNRFSVASTCSTRW